MTSRKSKPAPTAAAIVPTIKTSDDLRDVIRCARGGDVAAACQLIESFISHCDYSKREKEPFADMPRDLVDHVLRCAYLILAEDASIASAFGIGKRAGRDPVGMDQRADQAEAMELERRAGHSYQEAAVRAGKRLHKSESVIRKAYDSDEVQQYIRERRDRLAIIEILTPGTAGNARLQLYRSRRDVIRRIEAIRDMKEAEEVARQ